MVYIFQAKPGIYDLAERLKEGKEVGWLASRYMNKFTQSDLVYYWSAGEKDRRGIYGWGEITSDGSFIDSSGTYRVAVTCRKVFPRHLNVSKIRSYPGLKTLYILRSAMGTNFLLTDEESTALRSLIVSTFGVQWSPPETEGES